MYNGREWEPTAIFGERKHFFYRTFNISLVNVHTYLYYFHIERGTAAAPKGGGTSISYNNDAALLWGHTLLMNAGTNSQSCKKCAGWTRVKKTHETMPSLAPPRSGSCSRTRAIWQRLFLSFLFFPSPLVTASKNCPDSTAYRHSFVCVPNFLSHTPWLHMNKRAFVHVL